MQVVKKGATTAGQTAEKWKPLHVLAAVLSTALLPLSPAGPWPSMLGVKGGTQHMSGAAQTAPGREESALPMHDCPRFSELTQPQALAAPLAFLPVHIIAWGTAPCPRDGTAAVGAELLQTLTLPNPWESEIRRASWEENTSTTQALGLLCSEQEKTNILLLN